ncbi:methionyl-tRNA formyltransferase, partial [Patescibacteria group bacterium]|nr:methionyl-tRNA formyltransferase [Patescibacteria group bacterium]
DFSSHLSDFDLLICSDFGQKIPELILKRAKIAAINIHPSLLPKYIGPTPIQTAILNGDKTTGVSIIKMTNKIDEGPIYAQAEIDISETDDYLALRDHLATLGLKILVQTLPKIARNELELGEQDLSKKVLTRKISKEDGKINWQKSPKKIYNQIRAFSPWPGSYTYIGEKRLIIHEAHLEDNKLVLDIVQQEGKKPIKFSDFLRGFHIQKPDWFGKILLT